MKVENKSSISFLTFRASHLKRALKLVCSARPIPSKMICSMESNKYKPDSEVSRVTQRINKIVWNEEKLELCPT